MPVSGDDVLADCHRAPIIGYHRAPPLAKVWGAKTTKFGGADERS